MSNRWKIINRILVWSIFLVLIARGYQAFYYDLPLRAFFWDESLWLPILGIFDLSWSDFLRIFNDQAIIRIQETLGLIWIISALIYLLVKEYGLYRWSGLLAFIAYLILVLLSGKTKFYQVGQYFEYALQLWLVGIMIFPPFIRNKHLLKSVTLAIALTFGAHGLYALGFYPRPGHFVQMTLTILPVSESFAVRFLQAAGALDLLVAVFVWFPGRIRFWTLVYAFLWGLATSLARLFAYIDWVEFVPFLEQWLYQFIIRIPHFTGPLLALILLRNKNDQKTGSQKG